MKRSRSRGRRQGNPANRSYDSNGPDMKVRGNASTVYEKYLTLARDALTAGDPVKAENLFQHAEHYCRLMATHAATANAATGAGKNDDEGDPASFNGSGMAEPGVVEPLVLGGQEGETQEAQSAAGKKSSGAKADKGDKRRRGPLRRRRKGAAGDKGEAGDAGADEDLDLAESSEKDAATA